METRSEHRIASAGLVALTFAALWMPTAAADIFTYPSASCNTTLQACIDGASAGDFVEVATNGPISEDLTIDTSLTVRAAAGFSPVLDDFATVNLFNLASSSNTIVFEGFALNPGFVQAIQGSTQPFDVRIRNLIITDTPGDRTAIDVRTGSLGTFGPITFEISGNDITIPDAVNGVQAISVGGGSEPTLQGTILDNNIVHLAGGQNGAIGLFNNASELQVDVIGNRITGSNFNSGIQLHQFGDGSANVRIINNLVEGQANEAGQPAAVAIGVTEGDATFLVLNNTLVNSDTGISIGGRDDLGATWDGVVANNIVANMANVGVTIDNPFATVINEHNLIFNTGTDFFTAGPGTLFTDPQFVGTDDFHLTFGSPARNAGSNARVPANVIVDLDGNPRIVGTAVDIGAYELALLPGDYNGNGIVDAADYTVWRDTLGQTGTGLAADGNNNGQIDAGDYDVWKSNFGVALAAGSGANVGAENVPESSAVLMILALFLPPLYRRIRVCCEAPFANAASTDRF